MVRNHDTNGRRAEGVALLECVEDLATEPPGRHRACSEMGVRVDVVEHVQLTTRDGVAEQPLARALTVDKRVKLVGDGTQPRIIARMPRPPDVLRGVGAPMRD